jgi:NAD-dependent protein deacetylase/lipoamidase
MRSALENARARLRRARRVTALTGAGVSVESGLPTFRDKDGLWGKVDPEEVATLEAFTRNPKRVWEWYALRMKAFRSARPNLAHLALVRLERSVPKFTLVTQNIDNLHREAGSRNLVELHGNIWRTRCVACLEKFPVSEVPEILPPRCSNCGGLLRPDVVWFGETLDPENTAAAEAACKVDVFLVIGTSGDVWPAAGYAHKASSQGAFVVEVNTRPTPLSAVADASIFGKAGEVLTTMVP